MPDTSSDEPLFALLSPEARLSAPLTRAFIVGGISPAEFAPAIAPFSEAAPLDSSLSPLSRADAPSYMLVIPLWSCTVPSDKLLRPSYSLSEPSDKPFIPSYSVSAPSDRSLSPSCSLSAPSAKSFMPFSISVRFSSASFTVSR